MATTHPKSLELPLQENTYMIYKRDSNVYVYMYVHVHPTFIILLNYGTQNKECIWKRKTYLQELIVLYTHNGNPETDPHTTPTRAS